VTEQTAEQAANEPEKSELLKRLEAFGDPDEYGVPQGKQWWVPGQVDYVGRLGLSEADVPELMAIARKWMEPQDDWPDDDDYVAGYAPIHAWRCLSQLRAAGTVAMLLEMLDPLDAGTDDWFLTEFPAAFRCIGPEAVGPLSEYLADNTHGVFARATVAEGLRHLATDFPSVRGQAVQGMLDVLSREDVSWEKDEDCAVNGYIVGELLDLVRDKVVAAEEIAETLERAHAADRVFPGICGNWNTVRKELGVAGLGLVPDELASREIGLDLSPDDEGEDDWDEEDDDDESWLDDENDDVLDDWENDENVISSETRVLDHSAPAPIIRSAPKVGRNDLCPCGSGKKYKKCCGK